jgi:hypothetical protein
MLEKKTMQFKVQNNIGLLCNSVATIFSLLWQVKVHDYFRIW